MSTSNFRYVDLNKNKTNHFPRGAKPCIPTTPFKAWSGGSVVAATKKNQRAAPLPATPDIQKDTETPPKTNKDNVKIKQAWLTCHKGK